MLISTPNSITESVYLIIWLFMFKSCRVSNFLLQCYHYSLNFAWIDNRLSFPKTSYICLTFSLKFSYFSSRCEHLNK